MCSHFCKNDKIRIKQTLENVYINFWSPGNTTKKDPEDMPQSDCIPHLSPRGTVLKRGTINEPPHDKTNKMACAPSEDSDQPGHPPSLIGVFAVRMKKAWVLNYPLSAQRRLIRLGGCPG